MEIEGSVAVVTGGASGLGEATVRYLVKKGAKVAIFDLAEEKGKKINAELGEPVKYCKTDVTDEKSVQGSIRRTMDSFGGLHVAINCAGVGIPSKVLGKDGPMPIGPFEKTLQINLVGTMNMIRFAAEQIVQNNPNTDGEKGVVVNTASIAAFEGQLGQAAYAASKAGIIGMTLPIAREFADYGIRVVTIAPGIFDTPMLAGLSDKVKKSLYQMALFPRRLGKPQEYAQLVGQIIENPMLNGEFIRLDGGMRMAGK